MLSNIRSLENNLDLIQLSRSTQHEARDCCVFVFTETWLNDNMPDSTIQLHGLNCYRADRDSSQTNNTDGFFIIAGDFNHANLKTVLPKFYQHVNFATRGNNTLDFVYATEKKAYKSELRPHLGYSDHIPVLLIPAYRPLLKLAKLVQKQITVWPDNATSALQDCFQDTDWNMFKEVATYNNHTDLQEYTETVTAYIKKCIDDVTVTKTINTRANQKPWMTAEVRGLLKIRDETLRSGDKAGLKTARANRSHGIKKAKHQYAKKINNNFSDSKDTRTLACSVGDT